MGRTTEHVGASPPTSDELTAVALLHWPDQEHERQLAAASGRPRLLLLQAGVVPPNGADALEDWVRVPAEPEELTVRLATLRLRARRRAQAPDRPRVDGAGLLHLAGAWVALSELEHRLAALLVEHLGTVVPREDLVERGWPKGPPTDPRALDGRIKALRRSIAPLGLRIHAVAGRGYLLAPPPTG